MTNFNQIQQAQNDIKEFGDISPDVYVAALEQLRDAYINNGMHQAAEEVSNEIAAFEHAMTAPMTLEEKWEQERRQAEAAKQPKSNRRRRSKF